MDSAELLTDAMQRVLEDGRSVVRGLTPDDLAFRPNRAANSIGWLLWHTSRVIDHHVSELIPTEQAWTSEGWATRFALDLDPADTGYGHTPQQVAKVQATNDQLAGYLVCVSERAQSYFATLSATDYDRVIDESWDPPVTLGVRLVSFLNDATQHVGQAAYVRGLLTS